MFAWCFITKHQKLIIRTMKRSTLLLFLKVIVASALISFKCTCSEQLSTVFVLETADSDSHNDGESSALVAKVKNLDDSNTRIVTDEAVPPAQGNSNKKHNSQNNLQKASQSEPEHHQSNNNHKEQDTDSQEQRHNSDHKKAANQQQNSTSATSNQPVAGSGLGEPVQADDNGHGDNSHGRRIEEESQPTLSAKANTATRSTTSQQQAGQKPRSVSSTAASPYDSDDRDYAAHSATTGAPKTQERLLISITQNDDDDAYKPPHKVSAGGAGAGAGQTDEHPTQAAQHQNHKRKPAITISIQDANINKQNGGSGGSSAVIVRPGDDGQSIVIATLGAGPINNDKYNQRPAQPGGHSNEPPPPYREPINNPIQNIINQHHQPTSTTRRPAPVGSEYNQIGQSNRPITSALIDIQRPPIQVASDERPQRPSSLDDSLGGYDSGGQAARPTVRPVARPTAELANNGYGGQEHYETNANNNRPVAGEGAAGAGESKYPLNEKNCGLVHETRIVGGEEADPDDFMWMAAIIKSRPKDGEARPFCGGSLITRRHVLTAAHCLEGLAPRDVLVRLGSYDFDDSTASSLSADFAIDQFRVPAQYSKKTHTADIAIMRLKTPLLATDNYKTVCMPQPRRSYVGTLGTVTGYGSQSQTFRRAAPKLRQVTVPIWENRKCSVVYKRNLTESFLCAGYEEGGKDACQGDSGGPLMTEGPNERMMIVGVVSHGIGCGSPGYPGVYTRTTTFLDWIEKNTRE